MSRPRIPAGTITDRERLMMLMLVDGKTCQQISKAFGIKGHAVSMQFGQIAARLGIPNATRVQLAVVCLRRGLLLSEDERHADDCDVHVPRPCSCHRDGVAATVAASVLTASGGRP